MCVPECLNDWRKMKTLYTETTECEITTIAKKNRKKIISDDLCERDGEI